MIHTIRKSYQTKANMGMIDVTSDFQTAVTEACKQTGMKSGMITGFTTGGVAGLTTVEFEPGIVEYDLKEAFERIAPVHDNNGHLVHYKHQETWNDDNGASHIRSALLSPFITVPFVDGKLTIGPWQNLTLVECDNKDRQREIVFQVMGE